MPPGHHRVYDRARCYDVAFGFRDVAAECDTLADLVARHGTPPQRALTADEVTLVEGDEPVKSGHPRRIVLAELR